MMWTRSTIIVLLSLFLIDSGSSFSIHERNIKESVERNQNNDNTSAFEGRIVRGKNTTISKHPYQVAIVGNEDMYWGSGMIVDKHYVVTVCSLVKYLQTAHISVQIRTGSSDPEKGGKLYYVDRIICHPNYSNANLDNDIALLRTSTPIQFNSNVKMIRVAKTHLKPGKVVSTSGWGTFMNDTLQPAPFQSVNLKIVDKRTCQKIYRKYEIKDSMICAQNPPSKGPCWGDYGDPLVTKKPPRAYGLFSWTGKCADSKNPAVFADLIHANPFINDIIHAKSAEKEPTVSVEDEIAKDLDEAYDEYSEN